MEELWKSVKGYEHLYEVSSAGEVMSVRRWVNAPNQPIRAYGGKIIKKIRYTKDSFVFVSMRKNGKLKMLPIQFLVAEAFLPNVNKCKYLIHKDGDYTNNKLENLEWTNDKSGHVDEAVRQKRKKQMKQRKIVQLTLNYDFKKLFGSIYACGKAGLSKASILHCVESDTKEGRIYNGCVWMYEEDYNNMFPID